MSSDEDETQIEELVEIITSSIKNSEKDKKKDEKVLELQKQIDTLTSAYEEEKVRCLAEVQKVEEISKDHTDETEKIKNDHVSGM